jgi:hypothetical protein
MLWTRDPPYSGGGSLTLASVFTRDGVTGVVYMLKSNHRPDTRVAKL